jgi:hypothetical protein
MAILAIYIGGPNDGTRLPCPLDDIHVFYADQEESTVFWYYKSRSVKNEKNEKVYDYAGTDEHFKYDCQLGSLRALLDEDL